MKNQFTSVQELDFYILQYLEYCSKHKIKKN